MLDPSQYLELFKRHGGITAIYHNIAGTKKIMFCCLDGFKRTVKRKTYEEIATQMRKEYDKKRRERL